MIILRSLAFNIVMIVSGLGLGLFGYVIRPFRPDRLIDYAAGWAGFILAALRLLCGIKIDVAGASFLPPSGPALIAAQHQSAFDTLIWLRLLDRPAYVLKHELLRLPVVGPLLVPCGFIPVDREGGTPALRKMLNDCREAAAAGRPIVIFPEGTRVAPGQRGTLQPGVVALAKTLNLPVIPAATDSGLFWGRQAFRKRPGLLRIRIFPPLPGRASRGDILHSLEQCYYAKGVDNSVEHLTSGISSGPNKPI
jgi:1-acyl-sn-glycerol-3-phosphate acyltransferase